MDAQQFTMWLQGFAELTAEPPTKEQWQSIREHLQTVFTKVTPAIKHPQENKSDPDEGLRRFFDQAKKQQSPSVWTKDTDPYKIIC